VTVSPVSSSSSPCLRVKRWIWLLVTFIALVGVVFLFARTMDRDLNHDEEQFLAPAALLSRFGLQPWNDYAIFHLPNLTYLYAAADLLTGDLIYGARLVSLVATGSTLLALAAISARKGNLPGALGAFAVVGLFLGDPLALYTIGKAWNHEVPSALLLLAFGLLALAGKKDRLWLTALAGIFGGLAAGCRLTFAPSLIGFVLITWFFPGSVKRRLGHLAVLAVAVTLALAPSIYFFATQREAFVFGNLEFPRLRLADAENTRIQKTVTWWRKVRHFTKEIVRPSWAIFGCWALIAVAPGLCWLRTRKEGSQSLAYLLLLLPFSLFGCYMPSRYQYQHCFVLIPLLAFGCALGWPRLLRLSHYQRLTALIAVSMVGAFGWWSLARETELETVSQPGECFYSRYRSYGQEIRSHVPEGPVLTLAPTFALAAGLSIYPEFSSGPFAWRSAFLVPAERRARLRLVAPDDLPAFLAARPPKAILTAVEDDELEKPIIHWAKTNGFHPVSLKKKRVLWLPADPAR